MTTKGYRTEWIAKFGVATELCRRDYLVTFTSGNAPYYDLLCVSPSGKAFQLQVKGLSSKTYFPIQDIEKAPREKIYCLVYVPPKAQKPLEYFVATAKQLRKAAETYVPKTRRNPSTRPYAKFLPGVQYQALSRFKDKWDSLPS